MTDSQRYRLAALSTAITEARTRNDQIAFARLTRERYNLLGNRQAAQSLDI